MQEPEQLSIRCRIHPDNSNIDKLGMFIITNSKPSEILNFSASCSTPKKHYKILVSAAIQLSKEMDVP